MGETPALTHAEQRLAVLNQVSRILSTSLRLADGVGDVLRALGEPLGWDAGALWTVDRHAGVLCRSGSWRRETAPKELRTTEPDEAVGPGQGLLGRAWADPGPGEALDGESNAGHQAIAVPIRSGELVLGVIELVRVERDPVDRGLRQTLTAVAAQVALFLKHKEAEEGLREADLRYRTLVEQIPAITYTDLVDEDMTTVYISPQVETILGFTPEEWIGQPDLWMRHLHPEDRERTLREYREGCAAGEPFVQEYRMVSRTGKVVWFRDDAVVLPDEHGHAALLHGVMLDITERKEAEQQVAFLAYHDKLTGLPNRAMFEELLDLSLARAARHNLAVSVLYMDLDNFKLVNDSLGHEAGDELLRQVATRLRSATRETDLVARQGGDEFLLLLADLERGRRGGAEPAPIQDPREALLIAEAVASRVHESLAAPFVLGGTEVFVSGSIGVSVFPLDAKDARELLKNADVAMYGSKKAGPGGFTVYTAESFDPANRLSFTTRLRKAVERQHWELHYQPILDLRARAMVGVEALLRWKDPSGGLIAPGEFIPLAEEMGLIEAIGDWVVGELCRQSTSWAAKGLDMEMSFNLSPRQLWQPDLVAKLMRRIDRADVDPARVIIEITESTAMTDPDRTMRILRDLSSRGLRIAIDDFGTGYSSLSRLKHMPVDILKIDRSFIRDVPEDPDTGAMVDAMIQMAHSLGMTPLAEGIETEAQLGFLVEHGCTLGQGYVFSRAVPGEEIPGWHERARAAVAEAAR